VILAAKLLALIGPRGVSRDLATAMAGASMQEIVVLMLEA